MATLSENIAQVKADFRGIRDELVNKGANIPNTTPTSQYADIIKNMSTGGSGASELAMWNAKSNFGKRTDWRFCFAYSDYSGYTVPREFVKAITNMGQMFQGYVGSELPNGLDVSMFDNTRTDITSHAYDMFNGSSLIRIYDIGIPAVVYTRTYRNCANLENIEIIRSNEQSTFDVNCFNNCSKLTHVIFDGVIASDINLQWSPLLDEESLVSLLYSLKGDMLNTTTITLSPESWDKLDALPPETWGNPDIHDARMYVANKGWFFA